jgi:hypothetical protein
VIVETISALLRFEIVDAVGSCDRALERRRDESADQIGAAPT